MTIPEKLKSRKFWFALIGAVLPVLASFFQEAIDTHQALQVAAGIIMAYILGQAYVDGQSASNQPPALEANEPATDDGGEG